MSNVHKNGFYVDIGSSVLMPHSVSRKGRDMNTTRLASNINLLRYLIPPLPASSNMFAEQNMNYFGFKFTNTFRETSESRIIFGNNGGFQLMRALSKVQQCMSVLFHII